MCGLIRKHDTQQSIIKSMSWKLNPCPRENGFTGLNSNVYEKDDLKGNTKLTRNDKLKFTFKSLMTLCTSWNVTLFESQMFIYVETLHNLTQAVAADSVSCFDEAWAPNPLLMPSMKCFFFKCRGEHGAPESALTISSRTFCWKFKNMYFIE